MIGYGFDVLRPPTEGFDAAKFFTFNGRIDHGTNWAISIVGICVVFACLTLLGSQVNGLVQAIAGIVALVS